jgi:hypothetical protein
MGLAIAFLVTLIGPLALATPSDLDRQMARSLAAEGYEALVNKKYVTAEDRLRRADQLVHAPTIVVDHARALTGLGRLLEARERYQQVVREGVDPKAPASWKQALVDAEREGAALEPRLAWLIIRVEGPSNPNVTVDGHPVPLNALGTKRAVDPGLRAVRVTALGYVSADQSVTLREGEERELTLTLKPPPSIDLAEGDTETAPPPVQSEPSPLAVPMYAAFGAGAVGIVVGSITGVLALGVRSDLAKDCPEGSCPARTETESSLYHDKISRYHTLGTISGIGFGVGIAGAGAGLYLLLTSGRSEPAKTGSVQPFVGPGTLGVQGTF